MQTFLSKLLFRRSETIGKRKSRQGRMGRKPEKLLRTDRKSLPCTKGRSYSFPRQFFLLTATAFPDTIRKSKEVSEPSRILGRVWVRLFTLSFFSG